MTSPDEIERRRHRAAREELRRMIESMNRDYEAHTNVPTDPVDEDELDAEIEELEAELERELGGDDE